MYEYFTKNPHVTTIDAIVDCFALIPDSIKAPSIRDRANPNRFIDEYVSKISPKQIQLILEHQSTAF